MSVATLLEQAKAAGVTLTTAESCTGGLLAAALTEIAGASAVFERGFVTYSNRAKQEMLGVSEQTLTRYGAVSEPVAREMAQGALIRAQAGLAVSITGIAGPGGSEHKPEGRVCFGLAASGQETTTQTIEFGALGRSKVRAAALQHALDLLMKAIKS